MGQGGTHPYYRHECHLTDTCLARGPIVLLGDEVATVSHGAAVGAVTDIHGETFGDGVGDTITVLPAAVTLSTGDRYPVADLVLLRRAGE